MVIKEIYISEFGCFKDKRIEFNTENELNIIYGENESGKSTVLLFIKFIFYGLPRRSQTNTERERSLSLVGGVAAGNLSFSHNGKNYRIERSLAERSKTERIRAVCLDDGSEVISEKSFGELFFGVPREVFESSSCVGQMRSAEINGEKTAQSLANMLSSADESLDVSAALKKLDEIRITYRHKKHSGGSLYNDETQINALRLRLEEAKSASIAIEGKSELLDGMRRELNQVKIELDTKDALVSQFNKVNIIRRIEALKDREAELERLSRKKDELARAELRTERFPTRDHVAELRAASRELSERESRLDGAERELALCTENFDKKTAELGELAEKSGGAEQILGGAEKIFKSASLRAKIGVATAISALGAAALCAVGFAFINLAVGVVAIVLTALLLGASITFFTLSSKDKKSYKKELERIAGEYSTTPDKIAERIAECIKELSLMRGYREKRLKLVAARDFAEATFETSRERAYKLLLCTLNGEDAEPSVEIVDNEAERLSAFLDSYEALLREENVFLRTLENEKRFLSGYDEERLRAEITVNVEEVTPEAVNSAEREKSFLSAKKMACENKIATLQNELAGLRAKAENPIPMADRLAQLEEKHKKDKEFFEALLLAMQTVEQASASMRGSVTPAIEQRASEIMKKISGGRYENLRTGAKLGITLDKEGFGFGAELLSAGTRDAAYISLRIALMLKIYGEALPPLIFDESLCQLDDNRHKNAIKFLCALAKEEKIQILLFTSQGREERACHELSEPYFLINL